MPRLINGKMVWSFPSERLILPDCTRWWWPMSARTIAAALRWSLKNANAMYLCLRHFRRTAMAGTMRFYSMNNISLSQWFLTTAMANNLASPVQTTIRRLVVELWIENREATTTETLTYYWSCTIKRGSVILGRVVNRHWSVDVQIRTYAQIALSLKSKKWQTKRNWR